MVGSGRPIAGECVWIWGIYSIHVSPCWMLECSVRRRCVDLARLDIKGESNFLLYPSRYKNPLLNYYSLRGTSAQEMLFGTG